VSSRTFGRGAAAALLVVTLCGALPAAPAPADFHPYPGILFGVLGGGGQFENGDLHCYRHRGYLTGAGPETPGAWQRGTVFRPPAEKVYFSGAGRIYGTNLWGGLVQYRITEPYTCGGVILAGGVEFYDFARLDWQPNRVAFAMSTDDPHAGNPIYAIDPNGDLRWYNHHCHATGGKETVPGCWSGPRTVGTGWNAFRHVFPGGNGVIYGVRDDGVLVWYRHRGYRFGTWSWEGPFEVNSGFGDYRLVTGVANGVVYAVRPNGDLVWYRHHGHASGMDVRWPGTWSGPRTVGTGWTFAQVFVLSPPPAD
jgi:hypothetical protein